MAEFVLKPEQYRQVVFIDADNMAVGLVEASIRYDYVNGTDNSPVGFIEGIYVAEEARGKGLARKLIEEIEQWVVKRGCKELASDASIDNSNSINMHLAVGFEETERVVFLRKLL